jgi:hypothetical protein
MSEKNDSNIAVILSFFWSGAGQIYNGEFGKGFLLMLGPSGLGLLFYGLGDLYQSSNGIFHTLAGTCFLVHFAGWIYSIIDAFNPPQKPG